MGLDITGYSNVKLVKELVTKDGKILWDDEEEFDDSEHVVVYNMDYPERLSGLVQGYYSYATSWDKSPEWSYVGYNHFRETLCQTVLGVACNVAWADPQKYTGQPFWYIIEMSDCEGAISGEICALLKNDFAVWFDGLCLVYNDYNRQQLKLLRHCVEVAANDGVLIFH